ATMGAESGGAGEWRATGTRGITVFDIVLNYSVSMIDRPTVKVSVILERFPVESRWEDHQWRIAGVVPDVGGEPRDIVMHESLFQRIFPGFELVLHKDEAEGYYLNTSSEDPSVFVSIRKDEA